MASSRSVGLGGGVRRKNATDDRADRPDLVPLTQVLPHKELASFRCKSCRECELVYHRSKNVDLQLCRDCGPSVQLIDRSEWR